MTRLLTSHGVDFTVLVGDNDVGFTCSKRADDEWDVWQRCLVSTSVIETNLVPLDVIAEYLVGYDSCTLGSGFNRLSTVLVTNDYALLTNLECPAPIAVNLVAII